jgi:hypothetical protein
MRVAVQLVLQPSEVRSQETDGSDSILVQQLLFGECMDRRIRQGINGVELGRTFVDHSDVPASTRGLELIGQGLLRRS